MKNLSHGMYMRSHITTFTMIFQIITQSKPIENSAQLTNNSLRSKRTKRVILLKFELTEAAHN